MHPFLIRFVIDWQVVNVLNWNQVQFSACHNFQSEGVVLGRPNAVRGKLIQINFSRRKMSITTTPVWYSDSPLNARHDHYNRDAICNFAHVWFANKKIHSQTSWRHNHERSRHSNQLFAQKNVNHNNANMIFGFTNEFSTKSPQSRCHLQFRAIQLNKRKVTEHGNQVDQARPQHPKPISNTQAQPFAKQDRNHSIQHTIRYQSNKSKISHF